MFRVEGLGFRILGFRFRVEGLGSGLWLYWLGFTVDCRRATSPGCSWMPLSLGKGGGLRV